ncbi:MAG: hypothetical protein P4L87_07100 [Formivibrio sp.]|nr:hypothetical protein [Formivibrio sp.]
MAITLPSISSTYPVTPPLTAEQFSRVAQSQVTSPLLSNPSTIVTLGSTQSAPSLTYNAAGLLVSPFQEVSTFLSTLAAETGTSNTDIFTTAANFISNNVNNIQDQNDVQLGSPLQEASVFLSTLGSETAASNAGISAAAAATTNNTSSIQALNSLQLSSVNSSTPSAETISASISDAIFNTSLAANTAPSAISTALADTTTTTQMAATVSNLSLDPNAMAFDNITRNPAYAHSIAGYNVMMANPYAALTNATSFVSDDWPLPVDAARPVKMINTYA